MNTQNELVLYTSSDGMVTLPVTVEHETVWLTRLQLAELFDRDVKTIGKHIQNALWGRIGSFSCRKICDNCRRRETQGAKTRQEGNAK
ncbi:MAG: hypothetical protein IJQ31_03330 [Thermoguttaceae bacterium]|nr:hypothetical protein [Thermoguttaceae bacterium]